MAKAKVKKNPTLRIIKIASYKGYTILIQQIVTANVFQCVVFKDGQCYQAHNIILPEKGQKEHTTQDIINCGAGMLDTAFQIVDALEQQELDGKAKTN